MENRRNRVLIVDDDERIRYLLHSIMSDGGYKPFEAANGAEAIQMMQNEPPNLVILDIIMPGMDGLEVFKALRQWSHIPVIMLSAQSKIEDKTKYLDLGADDYMTKPFAAEEVLSRVRAVLRRTTRDTLLPGSPYFDDGYLRINFAEREVTAAGKEVSLTKLEYALLRELVVNAGRVIDYNQLLETVWGTDYQDARDSLRHCVNTLRKKIEPEAEQPRYIINLPQVGYRYCPKKD